MKLFVGDGSFFGQHHGNVVTYGINAATIRALEPALVIEQFDRNLADGADQHLQ